MSTSIEQLDNIETHNNKPKLCNARRFKRDDDGEQSDAARKSYARAPSASSCRTTTPPLIVRALISAIGHDRRESAVATAVFCA